MFVCLLHYLCIMNNELENAVWSENIIVADGDYIDKVAFNLIVNFERMIGRRIHNADIARWIDCIALDGGVREGDNNTHVIIIYGKESKRLEYFTPGNYMQELNGKAFKDNLGEFTITALPVEDITTADDMFLDILQNVCSRDEVKRIMAVPGEGDIHSRIRSCMRNMRDDTKRVTVFAMQPMPGGNFNQEILGYSLMSALGISSDEIKEK